MTWGVLRQDAVHGASSGSSRDGSVFRDPLIHLGVALAYFSAAKLGFALASTTKQVTAVWPPTGIAIAVMLLLGTRFWPAVWLGAFCVNASNDEPLLTAFGIACGNAFGPVLGAQLLQRVAGFDTQLVRVRDVLALVGLGAVIGMAVTAANGTLWLAASGIVPWSAFGSVYRLWWVGDAMGVLIIAPLLLTWFTQPEAHAAWTRWRVCELLCLFGLLAITGRPIFFHDFQVKYAVFPFAIWASLRFGQRETALVMFVIVVAAVWGFSHDRGPFSSGVGEPRLILLALFTGVLAMTALVLGAACSERRRAEQALQKAREELELHVTARTAELGSANDNLKRANRELARRGQEVTAKNEEAESFVYVVSHDLRAPLVNLQGFSEELGASCIELRTRLDRSSLSAAEQAALLPIVTESIPESLRFIASSTRKLQRLIDALLLLSRTGREEYAMELLDVELLAKASLEVLRQSIAQSGALLKLEALPNAFADQTAVGQVFSNLIGNAITYLQKGRPGLIEIGGELQDDMSHYWVRDNGCGISAHAQRRLFQVFQRFHPHVVQGEGMGLAIVKRVVERHGGRVWAESIEHIGTTFHFTLPAAHNRSMSSWRQTA
jgi:signal transduction histidine kinase